MASKDDVWDSKRTYAGSWVYVWIAMGFAAIGLVIIAWNFYSIQNSSTTVGTVISVEVRHGSGSGSSKTSTSYKPLFSFTIENGVVHERTVRYGDMDYNFDVGEKILISYDLEKFGFVEIVDWSVVMNIPKIFFAVAGFFILAFVLVRRDARKMKAEEGR